MPTLRWLALPILFLAISLIVGACGYQVPSVTASPSPSPSPQAQPTAAVRSPQPSPPAGPLLTVETRGGECPQGACGSTIVVEADGRVHALAPIVAELGALPASTIDGLKMEISAADFAALKSHQFTDTCPIAYDGQETIYTFGTASGVERIASCEVIVDPANPLFAAVSAVLAGVATH